MIVKAIGKQMRSNLNQVQLDKTNMTAIFAIIVNSNPVNTTRFISHY